LYHIFHIFRRYQHVEKDVKPNKFSQSVLQELTGSWFDPAIFEACLTGAGFGVNDDSKYPGSESPALVHLGGVIWVMTYIRSVQVSGFRFQQPNSTRHIASTHEMGFLSLLLAFSCNQISVHVSVFTDT